MDESINEEISDKNKNIKKKNEIRKPYNKSDKNKYIEIELTNEQIIKYINNKDYKTPFINHNEQNKIKTKYIYTSSSKNYIYYICKNRRKCKGAAKLDITKKNLL